MSRRCSTADTVGASCAIPDPNQIRKHPHGTREARSQRAEEAAHHPQGVEGYRGQRSRLYRKAKEQQLHSLTYAYRDRRARKGEFRKLWISRINAAARANDITYNRLIQGLKAAGIEVDRKNLAEIAVSDPAAFTALVEAAKAALPEDVNAPSGEAA